MFGIKLNNQRFVGTPIKSDLTITKIEPTIKYFDNSYGNDEHDQRHIVFIREKSEI